MTANCNLFDWLQSINFWTREKGFLACLCPFSVCIWLCVHGALRATNFLSLSRTIILQTILITRSANDYGLATSAYCILVESQTLQSTSCVKNTTFSHRSEQIDGKFIHKVTHRMENSKLSDAMICDCSCFFPSLFICLSILITNHCE